MRSLSVHTLDLYSPCTTPWPWDELTIDTLKIADLRKLPRPSKGQCAVIRCKELDTSLMPKGKVSEASGLKHDWPHLCPDPTYTAAPRQ